MGRGKRSVLGDDHAALLTWLPRPYFTQRDAIAFAHACNRQGWWAVSLWAALVKFKKIERTTVVYGGGAKRPRCYWQRSSTGYGSPFVEKMP